MTLQETPPQPFFGLQTAALSNVDERFSGHLPSGGSNWKIEAELAKIWRDVLAVEDVSLSSNFFSLGDNLAAVRLAAKVNDKFGIKLDAAWPLKTPTLGELAVRVSRMTADSSWQTIEIQPKGEASPIFAINNAMMYGALASCVGTGHPFFSVSAFQPGHPRSLPKRTLEEIATDYVSIIQGVRPRGPYVLVGLCVAGVIAYEAAKQLRSKGERVPLVVMADTWAPGYIRGLSIFKRGVAEASFNANLLAHQLNEVRIGRITFGQFLASYPFIRRTKILDLAFGLHLIKENPADATGADDHWFLDYLAGARKKYEVSGDGETVLLLKSDFIPERFADESMGWRDKFLGDLKVMRVRGWHEEIFRGHGAQTISDILRPTLENIM